MSATVGRPPKYETKEEMQAIIDLYFSAIKAKITNDDQFINTLSADEKIIVDSLEDTVPTVSGLAYILGMSRQALLDYENKDEFLYTVKRAKQRIEISLENRLAGNNVTGAIFNLKNNYSWKDKTETEHSGNVKIMATQLDEDI